MKRIVFFLLALGICVLSGCGGDTNTTGTTEPPSAQTQAVTLPDALSPSESALYFEQQPSVGDPALSLQYQGERYHAVQLISALLPSGGEVGVIQSAVDATALPDEDWQCNDTALVGQTVYKAGDCLYTVASSTPQEGDVYIGTRYRQWVKSQGDERFEGVEIGGEANAIRVNGALYYALYTAQTTDSEPTTTLRVLPELPTDGGFVCRHRAGIRTALPHHRFLLRHRRIGA